MKKLTLTSLFLAFIGINMANAQVGIGTTQPHASAALDVDVSVLTEKKGFLPPRMDSEDRDAITDPMPGLIIYNDEVDCLQWFTAAGWWDICKNELIPPPAGPVADCPLVPAYLTAANTTITDVTSPTGKTWMDRNLGAYTVAREKGDCWAYGNTYQWGRNSDGHEYRLSNQVGGPVGAGSEGANFITIGTNDTDWLSTSDSSRWGNPADTDKGPHDPCPTGYRIPSQAELDAENAIFSSANMDGAFGSALKLPATGLRGRTGNSFGSLGLEGAYWTSTPSSTFNDHSARWLRIRGNSSGMATNSRPNGMSVRCIKIASN